MHLFCLDVGLYFVGVDVYKHWLAIAEACWVGCKQLR